MRKFSLIAVCLLLVLAGCNGGGGGDGATTTTATTTTTTATTTPPETTTTTTTTTATTTTATTTSATTSTPGSGSGDLPADAGQRHIEAVREAGSLTVNTRASYTNDSGNLFAFQTLSRLDVAADRGYRTSSFELQGGTFNLSTYTAGDTTYERTETPAGVRYQMATAPYRDTDITPVNFTTVVGQVEQNLTEVDARYTRLGTTTIDGIQVTEYRAQDEDLGELVNQSQFQNATVSSATLSVFIDDDGIFRRVDLTIVYETEAGEQVTFEFRQDVTDVGSTTVSEPDWIDEARQNTR